MRRTLTLSLLLLLSVPLLLAQQKELTLADAILKAGSELAPKQLKGLQWIAGTDRYSFIQDDQLMQGGTGKVADMPLLKVVEMNVQLPAEKALKGIPAITWETATRFRFDHGDREYAFDLETRKLTERANWPAEAERMDREETTGHRAFTLGPDLYIAVPGGGRTIRVTEDGSDGLVNGRSVHREEYGISKGTFWSPGCERLAFYRMDESMVTPYQLEDIGTKPSTFEKIRYPMAGQASHHVTVGVYDLKTRRTVFLETGAPQDQYLTNLAWEPGGRHLFIVHLNRATDHLRLVQYDASTGKAVRTLLEERSERYVEPLEPMRFLKQDPKRFIWWSQRDGWTHLYLYDLEKGLVRQLTRGPWVVKRIIGFDAKGGAAFVEGTGENATETHLYRVDINAGRHQRLTKEAGTHRGELSPSGNLLLVRWSSLTVPARTEIMDTQGKLLKELLVSPNPLQERQVGTVELFTIIGEYGDALHARLIKPSNFDSRRRYPVLVYLYNGPHAQLVTNSFLGGASPWMLHAAERGYLVFTVDGHGSMNRGAHFEQVVHRRLGEVELKDQLHGVRHLKSLAYVDSTRMAVHGWSYGGFMTTALMVKAPGTFQVGVAGGPVMDWTMYEVMYTERYMDTPEENPEGYKEAALPDKAANMKGSLLIIHGGKDDVVLPEHSYAFIKACVDKMIPVDFFIYPGHGHNVRGRDRLHLMKKVLDYIDEKLAKGR
ncbi:MAG: S9 family peptidase [Flavobacteriales bacterium]|nr:S9 family peptidase [Flavobacteriales bacterium]